MTCPRLDRPDRMNENTYASIGGITNMSKTITLRISEDHYEAFKKYAQRENRKISNAIETLAMKQLDNVNFTDDRETAEILSDKDLVARIKRGAKQAKEGKGRIVE
jgi:hypothetical protein